MGVLSDLLLVGLMIGSGIWKKCSSAIFCCLISTFCSSTALLKLMFTIWDFFAGDYALLLALPLFLETVSDFGFFPGSPILSFFCWSSSIAWSWSSSSEIMSIFFEVLLCSCFRPCLPCLTWDLGFAALLSFSSCLAFSIIFSTTVLEDCFSGYFVGVCICSRLRLTTACGFLLWDASPCVKFFSEFLGMDGESNSSLNDLTARAWPGLSSGWTWTLVPFCTWLWSASLCFFSDCRSLSGSKLSYTIIADGLFLWFIMAVSFIAPVPAFRSLTFLASFFLSRSEELLPLLEPLPPEFNDIDEGAETTLSFWAAGGAFAFKSVVWGSTTFLSLTGWLFFAMLNIIFPLWVMVG